MSKFSILNLMAGVALAALVSASPTWAQTGSDQSQQKQQQAAPPAGGQASAPEAQPSQGQVTQEAPAAEQQQEQSAEEAPEAEQQQEQATEEAPEAEQAPEGEQQAQEQQQQQTQETTVDVDITAEQETRIEQEITELDVEHISVDFDVAVGVAVPAHIALHPVPTVIVDIVPDFAGYLFFVLADGSIVIVHPQTHVIVTVIA